MERSPGPHGLDRPPDSLFRPPDAPALSSQPYKLDFEQVSYGDKYFQCVYVLIKPTEEVVEAARAARKAFGLDENARYMPHLSLLYGKVDSGVRCAHADASRRGAARVRHRGRLRACTLVNLRRRVPASAGSRAAVRSQRSAGSAFDRPIPPPPPRFAAERKSRGGCRGR